MDAGARMGANKGQAAGRGKGAEAGITACPRHARHGRRAGCAGSATGKGRGGTGVTPAGRGRRGVRAGGRGRLGRTLVGPGWPGHGVHARCSTVQQ